MSHLIYTYTGQGLLPPRPVRHTPPPPRHCLAGETVQVSEGKCRSIVFICSESPYTDSEYGAGRVCH